MEIDLEDITVVEYFELLFGDATFEDLTTTQLNHLEEVIKEQCDIAKKHAELIDNELSKLSTPLKIVP